MMACCVWFGVFLVGVGACVCDGGGVWGGVGVHVFHMGEGVGWCLSCSQASSSALH